jgi:holin-like protein
MKTVRGMAIILGLLVLGEAVSFLLRIPAPGNVIGMVLMASLLGLKIIRLEWVAAAGGFLTENLALFFVPVGVGVIAHVDLLRTQGPVIVGVTAFSTLCVLVLTGLFHSRISRNSRTRKKENHE